MQALAAVVPAAGRKKKPVGNSWSNTTTDLIILIESGGFSGLFAYAPAPGPGNLVLSATAHAGEDPYGNAYLAGLTTYASGNILNMFGAFLTGGENQTSSLLLQDANFALTSGDNALDTVQAVLSGTAVPSGSNPFISAAASSGFCDSYATGAFLKAPPPGITPYTWQAPAYDTNWASSTVFNGTSGNKPLRYHLGNEDTVVIEGAFAAGASAPGNTVYTASSLYVVQGSDSSYWLTVWRNRAGTVIPMGGRYLAGALVIGAGMGGDAPQAGDQYWIPRQEISLGNIA